VANSKSTKKGIASHFKTDAVIMVASPVILVFIAVVTVLIAPKIVESREIDRCRDINGTFDYEKHECVVTKRETR